MPKKPPIAVQRQILKLEQRILKLEQRLASVKAKYEKRLAKVEAENHKLRTRPFSMPEEQRRELIARRDTATARLRNQ
jgi:hypothetical protein